MAIAAGHPKQLQEFFRSLRVVLSVLEKLLPADRMFQSYLRFCDSFLLHRL
jgi:hypothetical protein